MRRPMSLLRSSRGQIEHLLWLRRGRRFYSRWLGAGDICFDVGANVGERSRMFLATGATVVAVEPQPRCVAALRLIESDHLRIEEVALGARPGTATMRVAEADTISSLADGWIERVRASGRFAGYDWPETLDVQVVTLDALIEEHGLPAFCKIDVEGYEAEVLDGLSQPIPCVSFEFTPEWSESALRALSRLEHLGYSEFNFSIGESLRLEWRTWCDGASLREYLEAAPPDATFFGDVYARTARA